MHQPRARPPRGRVEAGLVGLGAGLAIAGERGVDQPGVERHQLVIGDAEPAAHRRRIVGDEHVGLFDQPAQHRLPLGLTQIERQALLVAAVEDKTGVAGEPRPVRWRRPAAVGVARTRRLDLDHRGAKIRHHRRRRRPGDKAGAIDDLQPVEDTPAHPPPPPVSKRAKRNASPSGTARLDACRRRGSEHRRERSTPARLGITAPPEPSLRGAAVRAGRLAWTELRSSARIARGRSRSGTNLAFGRRIMSGPRTSRWLRRLAIAGAVVATAVFTIGTASTSARAQNYNPYCYYPYFNPYYCPYYPASYPAYGYPYFFAPGFSAVGVNFFVGHPFFNNSFFFRHPFFRNNFNSVRNVNNIRNVKQHQERQQRWRARRHARRPRAGHGRLPGTRHGRPVRWRHGWLSGTRHGRRQHGRRRHGRRPVSRLSAPPATRSPAARAGETSWVDLPPASARRRAGCGARLIRYSVPAVVRESGGMRRRRGRRGRRCGRRNACR